MKYFCSHCENEIDHLYYNVTVNENGSVYWSNEAENASQLRNSVDYQLNESNWNEDLEFICPECEAELNWEDIIFKPVENEDTESRKNNEPLEIDDTCLGGSTDIRQNFIVKFKEDQQLMNEENSVTCGKCSHIFEVDKNENLEECPNCNAKLKKKAEEEATSFKRPPYEPDFEADYEVGDWGHNSDSQQEEEEND